MLLPGEARLFMIGGLLAQLAGFDRWAMPRVAGIVALAALWETLAARVRSIFAWLFGRASVLPGMEEADDENVRWPHDIADDIAVATEVHGCFPPAVL